MPLAWHKSLRFQCTRVKVGPSYARACLTKSLPLWGWGGGCHLRAQAPPASQPQGKCHWSWGTLKTLLLGRRRSNPSPHSSTQ